jgi:GNAT superfamily N-acetyltransferase
MAEPLPAERPTVTLRSGAILRPAVAADVPELLRLVNELAAYEKEPDAVEATPADYLAILFPEEGQPTGFAEVAELDGRLVGMALWYVTFSTWSGRNGIWLEDFFVEPEHRGAGVGHALFTRLARVCVLRGYRRLDWWVLDWNQSAIDFYESRGAQPMGEWTHYRVADAELAQLADG